MFKIADWFIFALAALFLWGVWGFFQKLATQHMNPKNVYVFAIAGSLIVVCFVLFSVNFKLETDSKGVLFAVLAGLSGSLGGLFFLYSISKGKTSVVITMSALYPVVTIMLSFVILKEAVTLKQGIGIVLALIAMALFSM